MMYFLTSPLQPHPREKVELLEKQPDQSHEVGLGEGLVALLQYVPPWEMQVLYRALVAIPQCT